MGGDRVEPFEQLIAKEVHRRHGLATIHATAALELALRALGVGPDDLVITQSNTFIAPINAISYLGAKPIFLDVDKDTLGMSPNALADFLQKECHLQDKALHHTPTGQRIRACLPVHALGLPARMPELVALCNAHQLPVVEDAAEALGSGWIIDDRFHPCGSFGTWSVISFNANKIITTGSGGMLLGDDEKAMASTRHLAKIAKIAHPYRSAFDEVGYNFAMPNLNAAIGLAQHQKLDAIQASKKALAQAYDRIFCDFDGASLIQAPPQAVYNHWILGALFDRPEHAKDFIEKTREKGVLTRPLWQPIHQAIPYQSAPRGDLAHTEWLADRVVQLPSWPVLSG